MKHYVCTECKEVSQSPGVCNTPECALEGAPLTACICTDGRHRLILGTMTANDRIENEDDDSDDEAGSTAASGWKKDDDLEDIHDDGHAAGPGKTLDLDKGDDAVED